MSRVEDALKAANETCALRIGSRPLKYPFPANSQYING